MKKITTVLLCMLLLLPFACNGQKPEEIKPITEIETEPIDTESGSAPEQMIEAADVTPTPWVESIMDIPFSTPTGEQTEEPGSARHRAQDPRGRKHRQPFSVRVSVHEGALLAGRRRK